MKGRKVNVKRVTVARTAMPVHELPIDFAREQLRAATVSRRVAKDSKPARPTVQTIAQATVQAPAPGAEPARIPVAPVHAATIATPKRRSPAHSRGLVLGGVLLIALSVFQLGSRADARPLANSDGSRQVDDGIAASELLGESVVLPSGLVTRPNPSVPTLEMIFCRGRQTSAGCSGKPYHPYLRWWESNGDNPKLALSDRMKAAKAITATFGGSDVIE